MNQQVQTPNLSDLICSNYALIADMRMLLRICAEELAKSPPVLELVNKNLAQAERVQKGLAI